MRDELYRDADVVVTADLNGDADAVVIAFSSFEPARPPEPFGDGFLQSLGLGAIFVTATESHWWQMPTRAALCAAVAAAAGPFARRIAYGASMGGFGALLLGREMGCNRIVAVSPQCTLDGTAAPLAAMHAESIRRRPILYDSVAEEPGEIEPWIAYDPHHGMDKHHVRHLAERRPVRPLHYPFAGHLLLRTLREGGILRETAAEWFAAEPDFKEMGARYLRAQHRSISVGRNVALYELSRGRMDLALHSAAVVRALGGEDGAREITRLVERQRRRLCGEERNAAAIDSGLGADPTIDR